MTDTKDGAEIETTDTSLTIRRTVDRIGGFCNEIQCSSRCILPDPYRRMRVLDRLGV